MIIKYIISILLGWIVGSILIVTLTTIRFGIPTCNQFLKSNTGNKQALKNIRRKYYITLSIWFPIIILITFLSYIFLGNAFYLYLSFAFFMLLLGFSSTGNTENNKQEFIHTLNCNNIEDSNSEQSKIIQELVDKSGLSYELCTDVFEILVCFLYNDKKLAYSKIEEQLIPHLKKNPNIGDIGIAFGMLIAENALSEEESKKYSSRLIEELMMNE